MARILGIDLGTNSIGWAITEENGENYKLINKGVNIFQEGVARDKNNEKPMVQDRTNARSLRRHYFRRRLRKIETLKVLIEHNLCPPLTVKELNDWKFKKQYPLNEAFIKWLRTDDNYNKNPYHDRFIVLKEKIDLEEKENRYILGRALYHISQRRGFLSNRKDSTKEDEKGKVKKAIKDLDSAIQNAGCEYIGEFFYKLYQLKKTIRNKDTECGFGYADRNTHYLKEFKAICQKQELSEELQQALFKAIFFQRALKSQKGQVGHCVFEKGKSRCPISHPRFEEFRMLQFINNIKIKTPEDYELRGLTSEEKEEIIPLFMRKSKPYFDFEEIAKKICGNKKDSYSYYKDKEGKEYLFNYRMTTTITGCPTTAALVGLFGKDWSKEICSIYINAKNKNEEQIINDIWHVLFSFDNEDKLKEWIKTKLQLNEEDAIKLANTPIPQGYASLSLNVIKKTLPYLRAGYRYDEAIFLANLKKVIGTEKWGNDELRKKIIDDVCYAIDEYSFVKRTETKKDFIANTLLDNHNINYSSSKNLYHPSLVEGFKEAKYNKDGIIQLDSPRTSSVRNPMAMRALFRLRALINELLRNKEIDKDTRINLEMARELNDANKRAAIKQYQEELEKEHKRIATDIEKLYFEECGIKITPTEDEILKYQLWEEQKHKCLYTGENDIRISDFIGKGNKYDIEHTIPLSRGGDNSQANKTLCNNEFNRKIKKAKLPSELNNIFDIKIKIEELGWQKKVDELEKMISQQIKKAKSATTKESKDSAIRQRHYLKMKLEYWKDKIYRFNITDINSGFTKRQGVDIGIISKYARMYLLTAFNNVHTVKGSTTADFRKMWGLQDEYVKKERKNHVHHCIDAITIACIGHGAYDRWKKYNCDTERYKLEGFSRPIIEKPWATFTEDIKDIANNVLVSHHTSDNMPKSSKKIMRIRGTKQYNDKNEIKYQQGDCARRALHQQTFYGAIKKDDEIKYVVRKSLTSLEENDIDKIVDKAIKECIENAIKEYGFKTAMSKPICFNKEKGVYIKKVRIYTPKVTQPIHLKKHQQLSKHEYKQSYHVVNDSNYCIAIYEGTNEKGAIKRNFEIINNLEASEFFNRKTNKQYLVPQSDINDYPLKYILRSGTQVLFYEESPEELYDCSNSNLVKRLYKLTGFSKSIVSGKYHYGVMTFKHHQEARPVGELKIKKGIWKMGEEYRPLIGLQHTQFNALVEGYDFDLTVTGEIKFKN